MNVLLSPISDTDLRDTLRKAGLFLDCGLISLSENPSLQNLSIESFLQAQRFVGVASSLVNKATTQNQPTLTSESAVNSTLTRPTEAGTKTQLTIGDRIRQLRKDQGITAADLAHMISEHEDIITQWESDIGEPVLSFAIPLCQALRCDLNWLITGEGSNVKPAPPAPVNIMKGADLANIGVRINNRRNQIMMSIDKLAEKIDTSGAMIREWETGKAIPHSDYIDKLAKALNTTVTWLITGNHITDKIRES